MFAGSSILLLVAVLIILGSAGGLVARRMHLPALTGQIIVGVLLGESVLGLVPHEEQEVFQPLITFALSLVAVTIGGHLEFRRLRNAARRILIISAVQTTLTFVVALAGFLLWDPFRLPEEFRLPVYLIVASIATSTSPMSTLHIIKEKQAKGLLVKTTIAVVAVNNLLTIALFALCRAVATDIVSVHHTLADSLIPSALGVLLSLAIGAATGAALVTLCDHLNREFVRRESAGRHERSMLQASLFTSLVVAMCFAAGFSEFMSLRFSRIQLHMSPILACLMLGLVLANRSTFTEELLGLFAALEGSIFTLFFVLAGAHFSPGAARAGFAAAAGYFVLRLVGKLAGGFLGGRIAGTTPLIARWIGPMLLSQGAIAIALVLLLRQEPLFAKFADIMTATVLTAVVACELVGGLAINYALDHVRESKRDRTRLVEFLKEEFIIPNAYANSKWDVLRETCHFLCRTHPISLSEEDLLEAVLEREKEITTALGHGVAVPHAKVAGGEEIAGVLALYDPPVEFDAPDGQPVRLVILVVTPEHLVHKHLEVIAAISRMVQNQGIREALFSAQTAEEVQSIIDSEEAETFNYFVDA